MNRTNCAAHKKERWRPERPQLTHVGGTGCFSVGFA